MADARTSQLRARIDETPLGNQVDERRSGYPVDGGGDRSSPYEDATMMDLNE